MNHEEILQNQAFRTKDAPEAVFCPLCDEPVMFALQDNHHTFSVGLRTLLECLHFSECEGYLPPLPDEWWIQIEHVYQMNLFPKEEAGHGCLQIEDHGMESQTD